MSHPLSRVPALGKFMDERFLEHRRRSTSVARMAGPLAAVALAVPRPSGELGSAGRGAGGGGGEDGNYDDLLSRERLR